MLDECIIHLRRSIVLIYPWNCCLDICSRLSFCIVDVFDAFCWSLKCLYLLFGEVFILYWTHLSPEPRSLSVSPGLGTEWGSTEIEGCVEITSSDDDIHCTIRISRFLCPCTAAAVVGFAFSLQFSFKKIAHRNGQTVHISLTITQRNTKLCMPFDFCFFRILCLSPGDS